MSLRHLTGLPRDVYAGVRLPRYLLLLVTRSLLFLALRTT